MRPNLKIEGTLQRCSKLSMFKKSKDESWHAFNPFYTY